MIIIAAPVEVHVDEIVGLARVQQSTRCFGFVGLFARKPRRAELVQPLQRVSAFTLL